MTYTHTHTYIYIYICVCVCVEYLAAAAAAALDCFPVPTLVETVKEGRKEVGGRKEGRKVEEGR